MKQDLLEAIAKASDLVTADIERIEGAGLTQEAKHINDLLEVVKSSKDTIETQAFAIEFLKRDLKIYRTLEILNDTKSNPRSTP